MSTRMARAERPPELATDWPLHSGHLIVSAIAMTRSSGSADRPDRDPTMSAPTTTKPSTSHVTRCCAGDASPEPVDHVGSTVVRVGRR